MIPPKKILFPVDFSDRCRGAAHAVRALAQRFEAEITALHVIEPAARAVTRDRQMDQAHRDMKRLIEGEFSGCKVQPCVTRGDPALRIIEHAQVGHFDLIMMPTHGHGPFRRYLLGSLTAKILHDARCPVWTSAHLEDWPLVENVALRTIVCGTDFGSRSKEALKCASRVAAEFSANLVVAHSIPLYNSVALPEWRNTAERAAEENLRKIEVEIGISTPVEILYGSPASSLSEAAERLDADLMVIGRTHVASQSAKVGSNAYAIIAHSPCPVLSV